jgi:hypothetical protein
VILESGCRNRALLEGRRKARKLGEMERVEGIEPSTKAWEAFVLPLNYTRFWLDAFRRLTLYQMPPVK